MTLSLDNHRDRYRLYVTRNGKTYATTTNDLEYLISLHKDIIKHSIANIDKHVTSIIHDYDLDADIYAYDSIEDQC